MPPPLREIIESVIAIDSAWDSTTRVISAYRKQHIYPHINSQFQIQHLEGTDAIREAFLRSVRTNGVGLILGSGHGYEDRFTGHQGCSILQLHECAREEVQGKIIHLTSCLTAVRLGRHLVSIGAKAFFGYAGRFYALQGNVGVFLECDAQIENALAEGLSAKEVDARVREFFRRRIDEFVSTQPLLAQLLKMNLEHLRTPMDHSDFGLRDSKMIRTLIGHEARPKKS